MICYCVICITAILLIISFILFLRSEVMCGVILMGLLFAFVMSFVITMPIIASSSNQNQIIENCKDYREVLIIQLNNIDIYDELSPDIRLKTIGEIYDKINDFNDNLQEQQSHIGSKWNGWMYSTRWLEIEPINFNTN